MFAIIIFIVTFLLFFVGAIFEYIRKKSNRYNFKYDKSINQIIEGENMSRSQLTILTNICLIEDLETKRVVMQYRSPETNRWSGFAFPGGHVENGESFAESVIREIYEETGLTIQNPQLVGIKNWSLDTGGRYIVICYKATEFSGSLRSSDEGEVSWVQKTRFQTWIWPMICYP